MIHSASLLRRFCDRVERSPAGEAVVLGTRRVSYAELWTDVNGVAGFLRAHGLNPADRVALLLKNSPEYVAAYYGAWGAGGIAVGLNPAARYREIASWIGHSQARWLFADARHPDFDEIAHRLSDRIRVIGVGGAGRDNLTAWDEVILQRSTSLAATTTDVAAIIYTSGTTGRPKGVTLTHRNLLENAASIIDYLGLTDADRVLNLLPFSYSYGSSVLHTHLSAGGTLVLENELVYPERILRRMTEEAVTGLPGVPSTFAVLLGLDRRRRLHIPSLRYVTQAGAPMAPDQARRLQALFPHAQVFIMYGQTEATARLTYVPPARLAEKPGAVGVPIRGVRIEIRGGDGRPLPPNEVGEVWVQGPNVMLGYYRDQEATAQVLQNGWLRTGDLGYCDEDGYLFLRGRRSDIIKSGAHRICPTDIENVIAELPDVAEAAVVGIQDPVLGQAIKAFVVLRSGAALDAMTVQRHCRLHLPRHKIPKAIEFTPSLPRTSTGKIMRHRLICTTNDDHNAHIA
jgi:acyl-CoA synthetase (AMP-forming)/AMP-acid ligase II